MKTTPYRTAVVAFKRELIETTLRDHAGNRTHAARALGIRRTYLLRLISHLGATAPRRPAASVTGCQQDDLPAQPPRS
jgi:DNA-binding NtrC family response regulator